MEITREAVRANIIERANWGAMKAQAPELYHVIVMLLAYIDNDFSEIEHKEGTRFQAKPKGDQAEAPS
jgi:hypothetical protein